MNPAKPLPLWAGRTTAVIGIILIALSLRSAVAAISPISVEIGKDVDLGTIGLGLIGMLAPVFFAAAGLIAPPIARRLGLEATLLVALGAMVVGHLLRAGAQSFGMLFAGSAIALCAMGIGNVLLPPIVKRYFPDRIGFVTALYATLMSISTALPALGAAPIADTLGWRVSLAVWSVTAVAAAVPWIVLFGRHQRSAAAARERAAHDDAPELAEAAPALVGRMWHSRTAWAITISFAVSSISAYSMFAWLPRILLDTAGVTPVVAGSLLALFSAAGLPASIIAPILVVRLKRPSGIILAGVAFFVAGYLGLLIAPDVLTWVWVFLIGLGPILFPVSLVLINARTKSQQASAALSGFTQGIGYTVGALGPLLVGVFHDLSGGWTVPLLFLFGMSLLGIIAAVMLRTPRFVEDDLAARN